MTPTPTPGVPELLAELDRLLSLAEFPTELVAELYEPESDLCTVGFCGDWRFGIHTGIMGGNYRDSDLGFDEAQAKFIAAVVNAYPTLRAALHLEGARRDG